MNDSFNSPSFFSRREEKSLTKSRGEMMEKGEDLGQGVVLEEFEIQETNAG